MSVQIRGLRGIQQKLKREIAKIGNGSEEGLLEAAKFLETESNKVTPLDKGPLRESSFAVAGKDRGMLIGRSGYDTKYAPIVHEMPATNNFTTPNTGPKFLEKTAFKNGRKILKIVKDNTKI